MFPIYTHTHIYNTHRGQRSLHNVSNGHFQSFHAMLCYRAKKCILQVPGEQQEPWTPLAGSPALSTKGPHRPGNTLHFHNHLPAQPHYLQTCSESTKVKSGVTENTLSSPSSYTFNCGFGSTLDGLARGLQVWHLWTSTDDCAPKQSEHPLKWPWILRTAASDE